MANGIGQGQSLESFGASLLAKKEEKERAAAKASKKNDKTQKALAVLLAGQSIFKGAVNKRLKELETAQTFELSNNQYQAKEINDLSYIVDAIPANYMKDSSNEERVKAFVSDEDNFNLFKQRLSPVIDNKIKSRSLDLGGLSFEEYKNTTTYDNQLQAMASDYAKEYLTDNKYQTFENSLRTLLDPKMGGIEMDRVELFKRGIGLSSHDLSVAEKRNYNNIVNEYKKKGNILGGLKEVFNRIGKKEASTGGFDPFKTIDENVLIGPEMSKVMGALNLNGITNTVVDRHMLTKNVSDTIYTDLIRSPSQKVYLNNIMGRYVTPMSNNIKTGNYPTEQMPTNMISPRVLKDFLNDVKDDSLLVSDIGAVALKLKNDKGFARNVYLGLEGAKTGELTYAEFKSLSNEEGFRTQLAASIVITEGAIVKKETIGGGKLIPGKTIGYNVTGNLTRVYDRYNGNIPLAVGEGIQQPTVSNKGYTVSKEYKEFPKKLKIENYDNMIEHIMKENISSETAREIELNKLFTQIPNPLGLTQEEYLNKLASSKVIEKMKTQEVFSRL
tara:strand:+ start:4008 stop:5678 length:1671 start_codon:yes stop_codon:yes gene_type:complete